MTIPDPQNKRLLLNHFLNDTVLFAYHIGDLDEFFFDKCEWLTLPNRDNNELKEVILIYRGIEIPSVLAFSRTDEFGQFFKESLPKLPDRFNCHYQEPFRDILSNSFNETDHGQYMKMLLVPTAFRPAMRDDEEIRRLDRSHLEELLALYDRAYPENYFDPRMLDTGKYFGFHTDGKLVAAGGVHAYSNEYSVAVLGNLTTDPEYRGRGIATRVTSRLVRELIDENKVITLNVKANNEPAFRSYRRLGFKLIHTYREGYFERK